MPCIVLFFPCWYVINVRKLELVLLVCCYIVARLLLGCCRGVAVAERVLLRWCWKPFADRLLQAPNCCKIAGRLSAAKLLLACRWAGAKLQLSCCQMSAGCHNAAWLLQDCFFKLLLQTAARMSRKLAVASWVTFASARGGAGLSPTQWFFTWTPLLPPLSPPGILKQSRKQMVTGSNPARAVICCFFFPVHLMSTNTFRSR